MKRPYIFFLWFFCLSLHALLASDPTPFLLPKTHRLQAILEALLPNKEVLLNEKTIAKAGFSTLKAQKFSGIRLLTHPRLKGYLIKAYLGSQERFRSIKSRQEWLIDRCRGALRIRESIRARKIQNFTVPEKWIYIIPQTPDIKEEPIYVVVETYMNLVSKNETKQAWQNKVTPKLIEELFFILQNGGASKALLINVPYTKEGKFAFIDTEYPDRHFTNEGLRKVARFFSPPMQEYWLSLLSR